MTLKHLASFPNCDAVRAVGLAPSHGGQPGCWAGHDDDRDGQSCEP
ncbi:excalibur calcium-binding domain-containing protein [Microvirga makkahensis]